MLTRDLRVGAISERVSLVQFRLPVKISARKNVTILAKKKNHGNKFTSKPISANGWVRRKLQVRCCHWPVTKVALTMKIAS